MATTTRGFRYPLAADAPNVHLDIKNLADDVDAQYVSVANPAALPAAGKVGRRARVADTGELYLDIGASWVLEQPSDRRAKSIIDTTQFIATGTNPAFTYSLQSTPDQITLQCEANSIVRLYYEAQWRWTAPDLSDINDPAASALAAWFVGASRLKGTPQGVNAADVLPAILSGASANSSKYRPLMSSRVGLIGVPAGSSVTADSPAPDNTTPRAILGVDPVANTVVPSDPFIVIVPAAGSYTFSVRFAHNLAIDKRIYARYRRLYGEVVRF